MSKLFEYVEILNKESKRRIGIEIQGLLGTVTDNGQIIFTTAGLQSVVVVEAFLGGMIYVDRTKFKK